MRIFDIAPLHELNLIIERSGMAHIVERSHSFTCMLPTRDIPASASHVKLVLICRPRRNGTQVWLDLVDYIPRWFTYLKTVTISVLMLLNFIDRTNGINHRAMPPCYDNTKCYTQQRQAVFKSSPHRLPRVKGRRPMRSTRNNPTNVKTKLTKAVNAASHIAVDVSSTPAILMIVAL